MLISGIYRPPGIVFKVRSNLSGDLRSFSVDYKVILSNLSANLLTNSPAAKFIGSLADELSLQIAQPSPTYYTDFETYLSHTRIDVILTDNGGNITLLLITVYLKHRINASRER